MTTPGISPHPYARLTKRTFVDGQGNRSRIARHTNKHVYQASNKHMDELARQRRIMDRSVTASTLAKLCVLTSMLAMLSLSVALVVAVTTGATAEPRHPLPAQQTAACCTHQGTAAQSTHTARKHTTKLHQTLQGRSQPAVGRAYMRRRGSRYFTGGYTLGGGTAARNVASYNSIFWCNFSTLQHQKSASLLWKAG